MKNKKNKFFKLIIDFNEIIIVSDTYELDNDKDLLRFYILGICVCEVNLSQCYTVHVQDMNGVYVV